MDTEKLYFGNINLKQARKDLKAAEALLDEGVYVHSMRCSQKSVELNLKTCLKILNFEYSGHVHDLELCARELLQQTADPNNAVISQIYQLCIYFESIKANYCNSSNCISVRLRYFEFDPMINKFINVASCPSIAFDEIDATQALIIAQTIQASVYRIIRNFMDPEHDDNMAFCDNLDYLIGTDEENIDHEWINQYDGDDYQSIHDEEKSSVHESDIFWDPEDHFTMENKPPHASSVPDWSDNEQPKIAYASSAEDEGDLLKTSDWNDDIINDEKTKVPYYERPKSPNWDYDWNDDSIDDSQPKVPYYERPKSPNWDNWDNRNHDSIDDDKQKIPYYERPNSPNLVDDWNDDSIDYDKPKVPYYESVHYKRNIFRPKSPNWDDDSITNWFDDEQPKLDYASSVEDEGDADQQKTSDIKRHSKNDKDPENKLPHASSVPDWSDDDQPQVAYQSSVQDEVEEDQPKSTELDMDTLESDSAKQVTEQEQHVKEGNAYEEDTTDFFYNCRLDSRLENHTIQVAFYSAFIQEAEADIEAMFKCHSLQMHSYTVWAAQQAAEKMLKGLLEGIHQSHARKNHNLIYLSNELRHDQADFKELDDAMPLILEIIKLAEWIENLGQLEWKDKRDLSVRVRYNNKKSKMCAWDSAPFNVFTFAETANVCHTVLELKRIVKEVGWNLIENMDWSCYLKK